MFYAVLYSGDVLQGFNAEEYKRRDVVWEPVVQLAKILYGLDVNFEKLVISAQGRELEVWLFMCLLFNLLQVLKSTSFMLRNFHHVSVIAGGKNTRNLAEIEEPLTRSAINTVLNV